ncbi:MAG: efflux RND transporter periplasmic adaptor subunit [Candidatus Melainabacteria bacterium]|nr:efflux RND transporter periplasmic adaptor subunit [Candidatus Melainabacteria bacterium]
MILFFVAALLCLLVPLTGFAHEGENEAFAGGDHDAPETVTANEQGQRALGLEVGPPRYSFLKDTLSATGEVQAAETQSFDVNPPVSGVVQAVYAKQGDTVKKGQVLALVHSIEVATTLTQLLSDRTRIQGDITRVKTEIGSDITLQTNQVQMAKTNYDRESELFKEGISARKSLQEAKNAYDSAQVKLTTLQQRLKQEVALLQNQLKMTIESAEDQLEIMGIGKPEVDKSLKSNHVTADLPIVSPVEGAVTQRDMTLGERVDPSKKVFSIVNLNPIWVMVDIYQEQIPNVKQGQEVVISTPSHQTARGKISSIGTVVDDATKTLHVRIVTENPHGILRPGMFVQAQIVIGSRDKQTLIIPDSALVKDGDHTFVYTKVDNSFKPVFVKTGLAVAGDVEILSGITLSDQIVLKGAQQLKAEAVLKPAEEHDYGADGPDDPNHAAHGADTQPKINSKAQLAMFFAMGVAAAFFVLAIWVYVGKRMKAAPKAGLQPSGSQRPDSASNDSEASQDLKQ